MPDLKKFWPSNNRKNGTKVVGRFFAQGNSATKNGMKVGGKERSTLRPQQLGWGRTVDFAKKLLKQTNAIVEAYAWFKQVLTVEQ